MLEAAARRFLHDSAAAISINGGVSSADSRGVAQPGRAPGSGPGGRRFKSSLPDHLFSSSYAPSKSSKIPAVGKNATVLTSWVCMNAKQLALHRASQALRRKKRTRIFRGELTFVSFQAIQMIASNLTPRRREIPYRPYIL